VYSLVRATVKPMLKAKYKLFLFHICGAFTKLKIDNFREQNLNQNDKIDVLIMSEDSVSVVSVGK